MALQTRDEATLEAVDRSNISTDHYLALAAAFRRRGLPLDVEGGADMMARAMKTPSTFPRQPIAKAP